MQHFQLLSSSSSDAPKDRAIAVKDVSNVCFLSFTSSCESPTEGSSFAIPSCLLAFSGTLVTKAKYAEQGQSILHLKCFLAEKERERERVEDALSLLPRYCCAAILHKFGIRSGPENCHSDSFLFQKKSNDEVTVLRIGMYPRCLLKCSIPAARKRHSDSLWFPKRVSNILFKLRILSRQSLRPVVIPIPRRVTNLCRDPSRLLVLNNRLARLRMEGTGRTNAQ